jgi:4-amino-4-deoxy-L-arabinose transferase-like glycosyltransferase
MVFVVGLLGRRVDGERTGLIAAAIAAVYPMLVALDGGVRSESLYVLLIALVLLFAYRLHDRRSALDAGMLGVLIGLAALTRSEALLLLFLIALPVAWRMGARVIAAACLGLVLVAGPWEVRNLLTFNRPIALTSNEGGLLAGANCERAYYGDLIGNWPCYTPLRATPEVDESDISWRLRRRALDYASDHAGRVPAVMGVRVLRTWQVWRPRQQATLDAVESERKLRVQQVGMVCLYVLALLAVAGAIALRRARRPLWPLLAPIVLVTVVSALTWGAGRFRAAADVAIVVLAAVAIARLADRRAGRRPRTPDASPPGSGGPTAVA